MKSAMITLLLCVVATVFADYSNYYFRGGRVPWNKDYWHWQSRQYELRHSYYKKGMDEYERKQYRTYIRFLKKVERNGYKYKYWRAYRRSLIRQERKRQEKIDAINRAYLRSPEGKAEKRRRNHMLSVDYLLNGE